MKNDYYYCIVLSNEQLRFFAESKYHIDRMKILKLLIDNAVTKETTYKITGFTTTLHVGQVAISAVELGNQLVYDKKTVTKLLDCMVQLGIITSEKNNRTSIHTLHCVSAWYVNNQQILNPHYIHIKDRQQKSTNADESTTKLVASTDNLSAGESTPASEPSGQSNFHSYEAESSMNTDKSTSLSQLSIVQSTNDDYNMRISSSADDDLYTPSQDNGNAHIAEHNNSLSAMTTAEDDETHDNQYTDTQPPHAEEV